MPTTAQPVTVRPFRRDDREQLTALVNAHVAAVVPGLSVSVNAVLSGLVLQRTLGASGTRFAAMDGGTQVGYLEVELRPTDLGRTSGSGGWADVGNLEVVEERRRTGVGRWLLGEAAHWLRLGHVDRLLDYADPDEAEHLAFATALGFERLTTTTRGWELARDRCP